MKKTIGELRNKENLTQIEMAKILGISVSAYNMYENGNRKVPEQIASKIAQILKVNMEDIFLPATFTTSKTRDIA